MTVPITQDLSRLKRRLAAVLAAAAVLLAAVSWAYYAHHRASLRADAVRLLLSTEQIKLDQLASWRKERLSDAQLLAESPVFSSYASRLVSGRDGREAAAPARERLLSFIKYKRYPFAAVADRSGKVLAYAGEKPEGTCAQLKSLVPAALAAGRPQMGEFYLSEEEASPHIDIVTPIGSGSGLLLLLRVNPADYLYPLLQAWSSKGDTGEILLVTRDGNDVLFLNDLRHVRNTAMLLRRPANDPDLPAAMGLRGERGVVVGTDYRGVKVLAAISPVEGTKWAMVTKLDWREVMAGSADVGVLLVLLLLSLLAGAGVGAFLLFKRQAEAYESSYNEQLARLNERLTLAAGAGRLGIWDWDIKQNRLVWDDGMYALYGVRKEDFKGAYEAWLSAVHPEDKARGEEETRLALAGEKPYDTEFRVLLPDGSVRHIKANASIYRDADGAPARMVGVNQDITERKLAEEAIRSSEEKFSKAFHSSPNLMAITTPAEGRIVEINDGYCRLLGYSREECVGRTTSELKIWADQEQRGRVIKAIKEEGRAYDVETVLRKRSGENCIVSLSMDPVVINGKEYLLSVATDITSRKLAEQALRASEQALKEAQRLAKIGSWEWDAVNDTIHWSEEYYKIYGLDPSRKPPGYEEHLKSYTPESAARLDAAVKKNMSAGEPYEVDLELADPKAPARWITARSETLRDAAGKIVGLRGTAQDITERKLAEQELRESERNLKDAQRLARIGNWTLELPSNRLSWSDEIYRIFEIDPARFGASYEAFLDAIHPDDREFVNKSYTDSLKNKTKYDIVHRLLMKDGRVKYVNECCETVYAADGSPLRSSGTVQDITERKLAEEALRESERSVRRKLDAILSPDMDMSRLELSDIVDSEKIQRLMDRFYALTKIGIGIIDMKGKVLVGTGWQEVCTKFHRVNPETCKLCLESDLELSRGVPAGETKIYQCKNHMWDMVTPIMLGDVHVGNVFLGQFLFEGEEPDLETFRAQARRYGFDEEKYLAALEAVPRWSRATVDAAMAFYAAFAEVFGQLSFSNVKLANTLEARNRAQAELEKTAKALREKNQEMENFLYITTHDLRSPLVNIQGFSQNIDRYLNELRDQVAGLEAPQEEKAGIEKLAGEKMPAALEYVLSGSRKMDALITALLKVSRAGRVEMRPEKVDAREVLKKVADAMRFQLQQCGAELKVGALPVCWADPGALNQVFSNLIDNAVKYRAEDRAVVIEVSGERSGDRVIYRVSDDGPGIPAGDLGRIWNVFYSHERPGAKKGEGIGLPMVKRLIEKNGGAINAETAPGRGISFIIELPAVEGK